MISYRQKIGDFGEKLAEQYLLRHGYEIIGTKQKISYQEIDIVARIEDVIVFIEVKTRVFTALGTASDAMSSAKLKSLKTGINNYLITSQVFYKNIRLDLVAIDIDKRKRVAKISHYKDIM